MSSIVIIASVAIKILKLVRNFAVKNHYCSVNLIIFTSEHSDIIIIKLAWKIIEKSYRQNFFKTF